MMPVSYRPRSPIVTEEERELWRQAVEGLADVPLDEAARTERRPAPRPAARRGGGIDGRTKQKLRRGLIPPQRKLDLHGYRLGEAEKAVSDFVASAHAAGCRCVLVVTGRKLGPAGPEGVLRAALPEFVRRPAFRGRVLAVAPAHRRHGGDAAYYLYLSRRAVL